MTSPTISAPTVVSDPSKIAIHIAMTALMGRAATDRCLRSHGIEPAEDRVTVGRQHIEAHGGVFADGFIRWPMPQNPTLSRLLGMPATRRDRANQLRDRADGCDREAAVLRARADRLAADAAALRAKVATLEGDDRA